MQNTSTTQQGFAGTLKNVQLSDILQMCSLEGTSNKIIRVTKDDHVGTIYLVEGDIIHAECENMVGEEAFYTIMGWSCGKFESIEGSVPDKATIEQSVQYLLMETCRRIDESMISDKTNIVKEPARTTGSAIRVLIVDDSPMMRKALAAALDNDDFIVAGNAANGVEALELIPKINPDVITLDINMPIMDGISALKRIMIQYPIPTIMVSALTKEGAAVTFNALKYGAVDFISKPSQMDAGERDAQIIDIQEKIRLASTVAINAVRYIRTGHKKNETKPVDPGLEFVTAIGAGEGGYGALLKLIPQLDPDLPAAFVVVLYASPAHVEAFARYLDQHSRLSVKRAKGGDWLKGGTCYLASGEEYITIEMEAGKPFLQITPSSFPKRRGSTNILMISLAEKIGVRSLGIVLSGASIDGAEGVNEIIHVGGTSFIQSPNTCLVREMSVAALANCTTAHTVPDNKLAEEITRLIRSKSAYNFVQRINKS